MSTLTTFKCKPQTIHSNGTITEAEQEVEFSIRLPNAEHNREASKVWNMAWKDAIDNKAILRMNLEEFMESNGLWSEETKAKVSSLKHELTQEEIKLNAGGMEFSDGVTLALKIRKLRNTLRELLAKRTELDARTAEGQADNERFNYYVSVCLVYNNTQKPVFPSLDDYNNNAGTIQAILGATKLAQLMWGLQENYEDQFTEVAFMKEFNLVDSQGRLLNEDGHLIDDDGRLINEFGCYIMPDGSFEDSNGNKVDAEGKLIVPERKPFTKNGVPIVKKVDEITENI